MKTRIARRFLACIAILNSYEVSQQPIELLPAMPREVGYTKMRIFEFSVSRAHFEPVSRQLSQQPLIPAIDFGCYDCY